MRGRTSRRVGPAGRALLIGLVAAIGQGWPRAVEAAPVGAVSEEDVAAFAAALKAAVVAGDLAAISGLIDLEAILDRTTAGVDAAEGFARGFREGARGSLVKQNGLLGQVVEAVKKGGGYRMLRIRDRGKTRSPLFRLAMADGAGVNYHEFELARRPDGKVRAVDFYNYTSGETISRTLRRAYVQVAASQNRGLVARLLGSDQDIVKTIPLLKEMTSAVNAGRNREAIDAFNKMPASVQNDKTTLLIYIRAAQNLDEPTYLAAMERYRKTFPDDPSIDLLSIDGFTMMKDYGKAIAALDRLDKAVGGDPYLNVLRASLYILDGKLDKAHAAALASVEGVPDMIFCYWTLVATDLKREDYPAVLKTLKLIDARFVMTFNDFATIPDYAGFVKSPQYQEWKTYQATKPPRRPARAPAPLNFDVLPRLAP